MSLWGGVLVVDFGTCVNSDFVCGRAFGLTQLLEPVDLYSFFHRGLFRKNVRTGRPIGKASKSIRRCKALQKRTTSEDLLGRNCCPAFPSVSSKGFLKELNCPRSKAFKKKHNNITKGLLDPLSKLYGSMLQENKSPKKPKKTTFSRRKPSFSPPPAPPTLETFRSA